MKIFVVLIVALAFALPAGAHQVHTKGSLSIMQHADPNDTPIAGTTTMLYLVFTDTEEKFSGMGCDCRVFIAPYERLQDIESVGERFELTGEDVEYLYNENYSLPYVFPKRDVYAIVVEGAPRPGYEFEPFRFELPLRVEYEVEREVMPMMAAEKPDAKREASFMLLTILGLFALGAGILIRKKLSSTTSLK